ncbi:hypothetical protein [Pseudomonas sp. UBA2684]|uniref:hypothetical protein n=1 Tax=Pseudomonas sp. UBA2684 TaxID=1947311 RepID=UPI000E996355|nr:hypothetical protein [Pseudomonas sp. UBA2684]HBX56901.1 hypothetical protein [Pseudomonas sp.]|tara:strand:- start:120 stop:668 length:549 start_codon:yes stop_codon:yes gene_type:complete
MTNAEWITLIIGSNALTLAAATFIAAQMDKGRLGKIELLELREREREQTIAALSRRVTDLEAHRQDMLEKLQSTEAERRTLVATIKRIKAVLLSHGVKQKKLINTLNNYSTTTAKAEEALLTIGRLLHGKNTVSESDFIALKNKLASVENSIHIVSSAIETMKVKIEGLGINLEGAEVLLDR